MKSVLAGSKREFGGDGPHVFPPRVVIEVKALACQLPFIHGIPLSRFSVAEIRRHVVEQGIVAEISGTTIWRWLSEDAIRPWRYRSWIFPRDPEFASKAGRVLDLYARKWQGRSLRDDDYVISADEKTSIQARERRYPSEPTAPGIPMRVEHEYRRQGAFVYLAALDVHRAKLFGRCEERSGVKPFDRLVDDVMSQEPYRSAHRVFWIMDNGSSHRGERAIRRLQSRWPHLVVVHLPVHASWLNQIEIYFSIVQRKVLTPNTFASISEAQGRLLAFEDHYEQLAKPFEWKFTRADLESLISRLPDSGDNRVESLIA